MNPREAFANALGSLAAHKLRTALTMLGMVFGVGAVLAMLSIGAGAERRALALIGRLGLENVLVRSRELKPDDLREARKKSPGVSPRDATAIAEGVPGVASVAPRVRIEPYKILSAGGRSEAAVYGVTPDYARLSHLELAEGRFLDRLDERDHAQVCVLGAAVRRALFGVQPALGRPVKINDLWVEVVGVLGEGGSGGESFEGVALGSPAREIYLPLATARRKLEQPALASPLDEIVVHLAAGTPVPGTARQIAALVDRLHAGERDYELVVPEALLEQSRKTQRLFTLVMASIAGISLLVGGIGIMNIMLATVLERTHEIGLRRAVGARQRDIRFQFVIEAATISLLGGLAGVGVGLGIAGAVALWAGWETVVTPGSILLASGVAMAVGLASGIYPASRAAELDPIEALRYE